MRKSTRIAATVASAGLIAAAMAAPASAAPSNKGTTTVTFKAGTLAVLTSDDFGFTSIAPTGAGSASVESDGDLAAKFGITGKTGDDRIQHVGGLALSKGSTTATLSNFTINTTTGLVSGIVNDAFRADLFMLGGSTSDGIELKVTPGAAALLSSVFEIPNVTGLTLAYGAPMEESK